ncbi:MAG: CBS domain-containing protein [Thermodesulfobacteriota bacterium]|nr:CBS domain-containing protein [Thermodesulfobacteriota bacterium]
MTLYVKDVMVRNFDTIHIDAPVEEAIHKILHSNVRETGYKTTSLMVVDDLNKLSGLVTMFDILYHLRPNILNWGIDGDEIEWEGQLKYLIGNYKGQKVHHIMTYHFVVATMNDHIMVVLDRMVKNKYRQLPVLKDDQPIGVVYISDIFFRLFPKVDIKQ